MKKQTLLITIMALMALTGYSAGLFTEIADGSAAMRVMCPDEALSIEITSGAGAGADNDVTIGMVGVTTE